MPYLPQSRRDELHPAVWAGSNVGDLTYVLTETVLQYLPAEPRFADLAEAIAALECAKLELYARVVRAYEDRKIAEHGDVYPDSLCG